MLSYKQTYIHHQAKKMVQSSGNTASNIKINTYHSQVQLVCNRLDEIRDWEVFFLERKYLLWECIVWLMEIRLQVLGWHSSWEYELL